MHSGRMPVETSTTYHSLRREIPREQPEVRKYILEKDPRVKADDPPYKLDPQRVISETKHTYTTDKNRTIHKKLCSEIQNPDIFQRQRTVAHQQRAHGVCRGRFTTRGEVRDTEFPCTGKWAGPTGTQSCLSSRADNNSRTTGRYPQITRMIGRRPSSRAGTLWIRGPKRGKP